MIRPALLLLLFGVALFAADSCIKCHEGIEPIRDPASKMMRAILEIAERAGHPGNDCIVCHGGNPHSMIRSRAHQGTVGYFLDHDGPKGYYPMPAAPWINENTCGICHPEQTGAQGNALMATGQAQVHDALWGFGRHEGGAHNVGVSATQNPDDPHRRLGTGDYRTYMQALARNEPQGFPSSITALPSAPTADEVEADPSQSVFTYIRQKYGGDHRSGPGCAACHIPYAGKGRYEGGDVAIDKNSSGHLLVHRIQSSRKTQVRVHDLSYSGVPVATCTACHDRGNRIGASYQGVLEDDAAHHYLRMQGDVHFAQGMLCQDCHTSNDLHGDGFLRGAGLGSVEIECQDCHGTIDRYPWELPLGYSDEFSLEAGTGEPRGIAMSVAAYLKKGSVEPSDGGYLRSARGNPLIKAHKKGNRVEMHLASGKNIELTPLKGLKAEGKLSVAALTAMDRITSHSDKMECYACHATWAPQAYGNHVRIDYSEGKQSPDHLAASQSHDLRNLKKYRVDGQVSERRAYLRWENPPLGINGEGRVSPMIPDFQASLTVIGKDGRALLQNHIARIPNVEGAGEAGQKAITMAPVQPHTVGKKARPCESCHADPKAAGYGVEGGSLRADLSHDTITDLMTADGEVIAYGAGVQISGIAHLEHDWDRFVDENGTQLQTVGNHWRLSAPLSDAQREKLDRRGVCLSCHRSIPKGDPAIDAMGHVAQMMGMQVDAQVHDTILQKLLRFGAWAQLIGGAFGALFGLYLFYLIFLKPKKRKERRWR